jgi:hypothetical protein
MKLGIFQILAAVAVFFFGVSMDVMSAPQQTVQYLVFVMSTLLFVGGCICLVIHINFVEEHNERESAKKIIIDIIAGIRSDLGKKE